MICAYIDRYRERFGVEPICRVLTEHDMQIAPSSYYAHRRRPVTDALRAEAVLVNVVIDLHRKNRDAYGIRKMWHAMTQAGHRVGRDPGGPADGHRRRPGRQPGSAHHHHDPPWERCGAFPSEMCFMFCFPCGVLRWSRRSTLGLGVIPRGASSSEAICVHAIKAPLKGVLAGHPSAATSRLARGGWTTETR